MATNLQIGECWSTIETELSVVSPRTLQGLRPGISTTELSVLTAGLRVQLPPTFRESYLRHDGQSGVAPPALGEWYLLTGTGVLQAWKLLNGFLESGAFSDNEEIVNASTGVRQLWWSPKWIPFLYNGAGDYCCVDLDPDPIGTQGQIIGYYHASGTRPCLFANLESLLCSFGISLKRGDFVSVADGRLSGPPIAEWGPVQ